MANMDWLAGNSGNWQSGDNWDDGTPPGRDDNVSIPADGLYTVAIKTPAVAQNVTLDATGATLSVGSTLTVGGTLTIDAGILAMNGGVIAGGTLAPIGGSI